MMVNCVNLYTWAHREMTASLLQDLMQILPHYLKPSHEWEADEAYVCGEGARQQVLDLFASAVILEAREEDQ